MRLTGPSTSDLLGSSSGGGTAEEWFAEVDVDKFDAPRTPHLDHRFVDHDTVDRLKGIVIADLALALQRLPVTAVEARRALGRSLVVGAVSDESAVRRSAGREPFTPDETTDLVAAVLAALFGLGRLQPLVDDPRIENIEANGCDDVWVSYADGRIERGPAIASSDEELVQLVQAIGARVGSAERTFTTAHPSLHLRLDDGSRLAAIAWTCPRPQLVIRRHRIRDVDLDDLVRLGTLEPVTADFLRAALHHGRNIVVTGLQNAGKTTLIRALANEFPPIERFATVEREYELHLHDDTRRHPRVVALEAREGSGELDASGHRAGEVTLRELVVDALRMNVRRIIVGEVRGDEVLPMLDAMSTGDGSLCTLHARSARRAVDRLVTLCMACGAGLTDGFAYRLVAGSVDLIVHVDLHYPVEGPPVRRVSDVLEIDGVGELGRPVSTSVFAPDANGVAQPSQAPSFLSALGRHGFDAERFYASARSGGWP